jgi:diguanylate cyclase (GGDEF)-like protein
MVVVEGSSGVGKHFSAWAEAAQVALIVADSSGLISYMNAQCQNLYPLELGDSLDGLFFPSELPKLRDGIEVLLREGTPVDTTAHLHCGDRIGRFLISRVLDADGADSASSALICVFRDVTEQGLHERRLEYEVAHDYLTGLLSRAAVIRLLEDHYRSDSGDSVALLFVDLDDFKAVNDGLGHLTGDLVLNIVARRLEATIGDSGSVARMGGDEFLIVLNGCADESEALTIAHRVAEALEPQIVVGERTVNQRFSLGVAFDDGGAGPVDRSGSEERVECILAEADMAMYVAKGDGTSVALADESTRTWSSRRLVIEQELQDAIETGAVGFHYQPIVQLSSGRWMAAEALLRWEHPKLGWLPPDLVVERAEVIGAVNEITVHTLNTVYRDWAQVIAEAPVMFHHQIAINASARQLSWSGFVDAHMAALDRVGLTPEHVLVEVTESSQIELHPGAAATVNELVCCGTRVSLDDFGVGYSALSYFNQFPIHAVKIDRSLVIELNGDGGIGEQLLGGVITCADTLGARVVGEGIETAEAAGYCRALGMVYGQGWHFGRPMPLDEFIPLAREHGLHRRGDSVVLPGDPQIL